ncbi:MAG TPA: hypothetical protein VGO52_23675 [Hyphomonadaceae bacterium]|nr:hypothetical protein [Hyphomonadaceae bacterium]
MVDIALSLHGQGHTGEITALSRRGLVPGRHALGGQWPAFLANLPTTSPADLVRIVRSEIRQAERAVVPWQRVIDSVRPFVARIWRGWTEAQKRSFLRHLRPAWDAVRHRMAPGIADRIADLTASGSLKVLAGRIQGARQTRGDIAVDVKAGGGRSVALGARHVINCTGPRSDFATLGMPLIVDARRKRLIRPDPLGLGIETESCAAISADGAESDWLYAVGALTRPVWWEVTAAPEINAQVLELAATLANRAPSTAILADRFVDLGAGI